MRRLVCNAADKANLGFRIHDQNWVWLLTILSLSVVPPLAEKAKVLSIVSMSKYHVRPTHCKHVYRTHSDRVVYLSYESLGTNGHKTCTLGAIILTLRKANKIDQLRKEIEMLRTYKYHGHILDDPKRYLK